MEREWLSDGRLMQRLNEGTPEATRDWREIGRWRDLDAERTALARDGWETE